MCKVLFNYKSKVKWIKNNAGKNVIKIEYSYPVFKEGSNNADKLNEEILLSTWDI